MGDITQHLKVVPSYIITSYQAGDYFQAMCNIIAPAAPMVRQQSTFIITALRHSAQKLYCMYRLLQN